MPACIFTVHSTSPSHSPLRIAREPSVFQMRYFGCFANVLSFVAYGSFTYLQGTQACLAAVFLRSAPFVSRGFFWHRRAAFRPCDPFLFLWALLGASLVLQRALVVFTSPTRTTKFCRFLTNPTPHTILSSSPPDLCHTLWVTEVVTERQK